MLHADRQHSAGNRIPVRFLVSLFGPDLS